jgi:hypothetical protein
VNVPGIAVSFFSLNHALDHRAVIKPAVQRVKQRHALVRDQPRNTENQCTTLGRLNSRRRRTLRALLDIECYPLALGQGLEAATPNGRVMHEHILTTVLWRNEAVALIVVKPLYCSCIHGNTSVKVELRCFAVRPCKRDYGRRYR